MTQEEFIAAVRKACQQTLSFPKFVIESHIVPKKTKGHFDYYFTASWTTADGVSGETMFYALDHSNVHRVISGIKFSQEKW